MEGNNQTDRVAGGERLWPKPAELTAVFPGIALTDWQWAQEESCMYAARDNGGNRYRIVLSCGQRAQDNAGTEALKRFSSANGCVRFVSKTQWRGMDVLVTHWPPGKCLAEWMAGGGLDDDSKMAVAVALCSAMDELQRIGVTAMDLNPANVFTDGTGRVWIDGVGFAGVLEGFWQTTLTARGRCAEDYGSNESDGYDVESRHIHAIAMTVFDLFAGALPRGSFFALPSQRSAFEPKLDTILMAAVGAGRGEEIDSVIELRGLLSRVCHGNATPIWEPLATEEVDVKKSQKRRSESALDGLFSWLPGGFVLGSLALGIIVAALIGFVNWKQADMVKGGHVSMDPTMEILDEAEALFELGKRIEAMQKIALVSEGAPTSGKVMERMGGILVDAGEYDGFDLHGRRYLDREILAVAERKHGGDEVMGMIEAFERLRARIEGYRDAMALAEKAGELGEAFMQHAALQRALSEMPGDQAAKAMLEENPFEVHQNAVAALEVLSRTNPSKQGLRWRLVTSAEGISIDVSGNSGLRNLEPLSSQPVAALDLSDTGVSALGSLKTLKLRELDVRGTKVRTMVPVHAAPLEKVWIYGSRVSDNEVLDGSVASVHDFATSYATAGAEFGMPSPGARWCNSLGMELVVLPCGGRIGRREVQVRQFRQFVRETRRRVGRKTLPEAPRSWPPDANAARGERTPVTWVSRADAEAFCAWLTQRERSAGWLDQGYRYRLPTDREWGAAAGFDEMPEQSVSARARTAAPYKLSAARDLLVLAQDFAGIPEPEGGIAVDRETPGVIAASALGVVGRFECWRGADDLAVGASEWLSEAWDESSGMGVVRGGSWRQWKEGTVGNALLARRAVEPGHRADDIGFRVVLVNAVDDPPASSYAALSAAGKWDDLRLAARERLSRKSTPVERQMADSILNAFGSKPRAVNRNKERHALVELPLSEAEAKAFCRHVGGELAVPRDDNEAAWIWRRFCAPSDPSPIWLGDGQLALPWPAERIGAAIGERHAFVVRWAVDDSDLAGAGRGEPES